MIKTLRKSKGNVGQFVVFIAGALFVTGMFNSISMAATTNNTTNNVMAPLTDAQKASLTKMYAAPAPAPQTGSDSGGCYMTQKVAEDGLSAAISRAKAKYPKAFNFLSGIGKKEGCYTYTVSWNF